MCRVVIVRPKSLRTSLIVNAARILIEGARNGAATSNEGEKENLFWENEFQFLHPWFGYTVLRRFCQQCSVQLHSSGWQPLLVHLKRCHLWWNCGRLLCYVDMMTWLFLQG